MDWIAKVFNALKIPLKVLLPAVLLFSGLLTLLPDEVLDFLSLLQWKESNGFLLGLLFVISSCFIFIYIVYFIKEKASRLVFEKTLNRKTFKRLTKLDDTRLAIIIALYNSPGYTRVLNYGEPLVQALLAEKYIYAGGDQMVSVNTFTNEIPAKFTLQPYVYRALDHYKPKVEKEIKRLSERISVEKYNTKKLKLQEELDNTKDNYNAFYNGGYLNGQA